MRVGYLLSDKKLTKPIIQGLLHRPHSSLQWIPLSEPAAIASNLPLTAVLLRKRLTPQESALLSALCLQYSILLIDKEPVPTLSSRTQMLNFIEDQLTAHISGSIPHPAHLSAPPRLNLSQATTLIHRGIPVVCKEDCASNHNLKIIWTLEGLDSINGQGCVLQPWIPHANRLYKVFVIGRVVRVVVRRSITLPLCVPPGGVFMFNTQLMDREPVAEGDYGRIGHQLLESVALEIGQRLGISVFGFDVIRSEGGSMLYLIDINYFPGFDGVPDAGELLYQHVVALCEKEARE